jgi:hypothetical protein
MLYFVVNLHGFHQEIFIINYRLPLGYSVEHLGYG